MSVLWWNHHNTDMASEKIKLVKWDGSSYKDFRSFPDLAQDVMGFALYQGQVGRIHASAKPLKGFGGASVIEIVEDHQGDAYRAIYTVKFENAIYVLYAFQKKSKKGIQTPQTQAAQLMGLSQPDVSRLLKGQFRDVSVERIMRMLTRLGCKVDIVIKEPGRKKVSSVIHLEEARA